MEAIEHNLMPARKNPPAQPPLKVDRKWFEARIGQAGLSMARLSKQIMGHDGLLRRTFAGERRAQVEEMLALADALSVPFATIVRRYGYDVPATRCSLIGSVNSAGRVNFYAPDRQAVVEAPLDESPGLVAIVVEASHSALAIFDGSTLFYEPATDVRPDAFGRLSVVSLGEQPAPVVGVIERGGIGRTRVVVYGGIETLESRELKSATPIRWQRAG